MMRRAAADGGPDAVHIAPEVGAMGHAEAGQPRFSAICALRHAKSATLTALAFARRDPRPCASAKQWVDTGIGFARKRK